MERNSSKEERATDPQASKRSAGATRLRCSLLHDPKLLASGEKQDEYWPYSFIRSFYDFPRQYKYLTRSELTES